jgi:hypothetical protein
LTNLIISEVHPALSSIAHGSDQSKASHQKRERQADKKAKLSIFVANPINHPARIVP